MRDEGLYLADIVAAADAIDRFLAGMTEDDWIEVLPLVQPWEVAGGEGINRPVLLVTLVRR